MINNLSKSITARLLSNGSISKDEQELYTYGFFMIFSHIMYLVLACTFGFLLDCFIESIVFYVAFQSIRIYAGGYHASTETRCEIMSALSLFVCIFVIRLAKIYNLQTELFIIEIFSSVLILLFSPLDTPEKPLSKKEIKHFRKITWIVVTVITLVIVISYFLNFDHLFLPCCMSLILESELLILGKLKQTIIRRKSDR